MPAVSSPSRSRSGPSESSSRLLQYASGQSRRNASCTGSMATVTAWMRATRGLISRRPGEPVEGSRSLDEDAAAQGRIGNPLRQERKIAKVVFLPERLHKVDGLIGRTSGTAGVRPVAAPHDPVWGGVNIGASDCGDVAVAGPLGNLIGAGQFDKSLPGPKQLHDPFKPGLPRTVLRLGMGEVVQHDWSRQGRD